MCIIKVIRRCPPKSCCDVAEGDLKDCHENCSIAQSSDAWRIAIAL